MTYNTFLLAWTVQIMHNYPLFLPTVPALHIFSVIYAAFLQQRVVRGGGSGEVAVRVNSS